LIEIFVDADACPVKDEIYIVGTRYGLRVVLVANAKLFVPEGMGAILIVVEQGPDVADDWIAEHVRTGDVVVTADLPLAARCLERGAYVLGSHGRVIDEDAIGGLLATRGLKEHLRESGVNTGGPPPTTDKDRSHFLSKLDGLVQKSLREQPSPR